MDELTIQGKMGRVSHPGLLDECLSSENFRFGSNSVNTGLIWS